MALATRNRQRTTTTYVCTWCKTDLTLDTRFATPAGFDGDLWVVGRLVCGPDCPERPAGAVVYLRGAL